MKTFSFLIKDGFRVDVKAATPKKAYKYLKFHFPLLGITKQYLDYAKDSSVYGWRSV